MNEEALLLTPEEICGDCHMFAYRETTWAAWCLVGKCKTFEACKQIAKDQLAKVLKYRLDRPELKEKIADIKLSFGIGGCRIGEHYADQILALLPQDKPPLLGSRDSPYKTRKYPRVFAEGAQAQWDICVKHYEGGL